MTNVDGVIIDICEEIFLWCFQIFSHLQLETKRRNILIAKTDEFIKLLQKEEL